MAAEKSPAFQFYPKDILSDHNVAGMSNRELGAYIKLLCICWINVSLPTVIARLANMVGESAADFEAMWPAIEPCFVVDGDRLKHPRLDRERKKQADYREEQAAKGRKSAAKRSTVVQPRFNHGSTGVATVVQPEGQPKPNSPISVSDLPTKNVHTQELSDIDRRASRFIDRFAELYSQERGGARYMGRPALDWPRAQDIVRAWTDDDWLEKLVIVFLNSDQKFIAESTRSIPVFHSRASWCDDRLREGMRREGRKVS